MWMLMCERLTSFDINDLNDEDLTTQHYSNSTSVALASGKFSYTKRKMSPNNHEYSTIHPQNKVYHL